MRPPPPASGRGPARRGRRWAGWLLPAILGSLGGSGPEVVKVRVPAAKVASWFPPGSDLHVLPIAQFEGLLQAIRDRPAPSSRARLLGAGHSARWESGLLVGRTVLAVEPPGGPEPGLVVVEPWSPATDSGGPGSRSLRSTADGRLAVQVAPAGPSAVEFDWRARARPGSDGRAFSLALPELDLASLALDLPAGLVPEANAASRIGPEPGPSPGRSSWRFEAARGRIDLRLRDPSREAAAGGGPALWLEGPTRLDLGLSPANWRADWTLEESPGAPRRLAIGLDPGLDLLDVSGPRVASFRAEAGGEGTRVEVGLDGEGVGPSPLTIRAICRAPAEGRWVVPSARPLDAIWTGGETTVRLDGSRVLQSCRPRAGRRVAPRAGRPAEPSTLTFEPDGGPGPVAELTFRRPTAESTVEVRGHLRLGDEAPRIDVALTWTAERGRPLARSVDLPPGWATDRVLSASGRQVAWHGDRLSGGGTRVHIGPPPPEDDGRVVTLTLGASAPQSGVTGPLDLPRVRPAPGPRVLDEVWAATPDPGLTLRPTLARGLAWIDPPDPPLDEVPTPWVADDLRNALAWRWTSDDAEARVDRVPLADHPRGEVEVDASIVSGGLRLRWAIAVDSRGADLRSIPIHLDEPVDSPIPWRSRAAGGPAVAARPLDADRRSALGFPPTGSAYELELSGVSRGRVEVVGQLERPWTGSGRLPLLMLPDRFRTRGLVTVRVEDSTRVKFVADELTPIDRSVRPVDGPPGEEDTATGPAQDQGQGPRTRRAAMFGYRSAGARLALETTRDPVEAQGGLVSEAFLASQVFPGEGVRHRLTLKVRSGVAGSVEFRMPDACPVDQVRLDGRRTVPSTTGELVRVEIPEPGAGRPSTTVSIDYRTPLDGRSRRLEPARLLPRFSLPCLSFVWELVAPGPWTIGGATAGLVDTDGRPGASAASKVLGLGWSPWGRADLGPPAGLREAMLLDLDKSATDVGDGETRLGDWLLKLDAGRWPIVVDRLALRSAGLGPDSTIRPSPPGTKAADAARSTLRTLGLVAIPRDGLVLVTALSELADRPAGPDAWPSGLREVPATGSDATDRFQSPGRWRGEGSPRALPAGESPDRSPVPGGWHAHRLVSAGWPGPRASVTLVDPRVDQARGWLVALAVLLAGFLGRDLSPKIRGVGLATTLAIASLGLAWTWPEPAVAWSGAVRGGLAALAFWMGRSLRAPIVRAPAIPPDEASTTSRRGGSVAGLGTATLALAWVGLGPFASSASVNDDAPILAVLPFEGPADPAARPDRVVLRREDGERLGRLARPGASTGPGPASLRSASHHVTREGPGLAIVESRYEVEVVGEGPATWTLPVGLGLDLSATVDDRPSSLRIAADGRSASVAIGGPGAHRLHFRRSLRLATTGRDLEQLRLPVNRAAFARVEVAKGADALRVEVPSASGGLDAGPGGVGGGLGPADVLEVRWSPGGPTPPSESQGPVDAGFLWDARPCGDLIRSRLTHSDPAGASTIRIALEPGLLVRRHSIPGVVDVRWGGTAGRPEWVAHVEPPLPKGRPIEVEFWRAGRAGAADRRWPSIEILAPGRPSGLLGLRRPADWSGRLEPRAGIAPAAEASFLKGWGDLPDDGLVLAGAVRLDAEGPPGVALQPKPPARTVRPRVLVGLAPGRMDVVIDAVLDDRQGRSFGLDVGLPTDLRVTRVEAAGLVDWQKIARDRLRLQFDGSEAVARPIRVEGHLPVPADSAMTEARGHQSKIPWPRWFDAEALPGRLIIAGATRFQFEAGEGVVPLPAAGPAESDDAFRAVFEVERPLGLSQVRWSVPPSKVGVSVQSELTIDPGGATWTAVVDCEITGGPADSLHWNLPSRWAEGATLAIEGVAHRLVVERKGPRGEVTQWTILPESPIWGRSRMVLRGRRPLEPGVQFDYPELSPLAAVGRGSVVGYDLAIANVSGRPMDVAKSPGLQPMDVARFRGEDSPSPPGSVDHAYHVTGDRWWLRVRVGSADDRPPGPSEGESARVLSAQLSCSIREDGELLGRARYDLGPRPGAFLEVRLPGPAAVAWASVDDVIIPVLDAGGGRHLVPLGDGDARNVILCWRASRAGPGPGPGRAEGLAWPTLDQADVPTLISVSSPESVEVAASSVDARRLGPADWESEVVERLARKVADALPVLDRRSRADREHVLDDLVEIELGNRSLARGLAISTPPAEVAPGRLQAALSSLAEVGQATGQADLTEEARGRVGLSRGPEVPADGPRVEPGGDPARIRRIGQTARFRCVRSRPGQPPPIAWGPRAGRERRPEAWWVGAIGLSIASAAGRWAARPRLPRGRLGWALSLPVVIALLMLEPAGTGLLLGLVVLGRVVA